MHEIERKFLVGKPLREIVSQSEAVFGTRIEQCYLPKTGEWTVRVRRTSNASGDTLSCVQTMKRRITNISCVELETEVSNEYFEKLKSLSGPVLEKTRFTIRHADHAWEIDLFTQPQLGGLVMAEIELDAEDEIFAMPEWIGTEVTDDRSYKNAKLVRLLNPIA